jgi:hypothetical protein
MRQEFIAAFLVLAAIGARIFGRKRKGEDPAAAKNGPDPAEIEREEAEKAREAIKAGKPLPAISSHASAMAKHRHQKAKAAAGDASN